MTCTQDEIMATQRAILRDVAIAQEQIERCLKSRCGRVFNQADHWRWAKRDLIAAYHHEGEKFKRAKK